MEPLRQTRWNPDRAATGAGEEILFVLGAARSGTTLLGRLLSLYFDYGIAGEGHWILPFARRTASYGDLRDDANLDRLIRDILDQRTFRILREPEFGWSLDIQEEAIRRGVASRTYAGVVHAVLIVIARTMHCSRAGSKDPGFAEDPETLERAFGEQGRYLAIVRDGRDVALSVKKQPWGQNSAYGNARVWTGTCRRLEALGRNAGDRFLAIRYEDLLSNPERTCREIERFLAVPLEAERRAELVAEISGGVRSRNYGKWRKEMSGRDLRLYEAVAGPMLERFGYARGVLDARASAWEHAWYTASEYARRARRKAAVALGIEAPDRPTSTDPEAGI